VLLRMSWREMVLCKRESHEHQRTRKVQGFAPLLAAVEAGRVEGRRSPSPQTSFAGDVRNGNRQPDGNWKT
jgi:hypothetical protein